MADLLGSNKWGMSPIKDFRMAYEALNKEGTFSAGDTVTGTVSLTLTKDTKVKSLFVKAKGEVNVSWTERIGEDQETYIAHKRYFKVKECLVTENAKGKTKKTVASLICLDIRLCK